MASRVNGMRAAIYWSVVGFCGLVIMFGYTGWMILGILNDIGDFDLHVTYPTYHAMVSDDAMRRGWIPEWVPESATNFEECHNVDNNMSWLRFSVPSDAVASVIDALTPVSRDLVRLPDYPPAISAPWWPEALTGNTVGDEYAYFLKLDGPGFTYVIAVDRAQNMVWRWRAP